MRRRLTFRSERGASLVLFALFLPVLFGFFAFVVDTGNAYGVKRATQNAADAAALAAVQDLDEIVAACASDLACYQGSADTYRDGIAETALEYGQANEKAEGLAALEECDELPPGEPKNCYTWPYPDDSALENFFKVEVFFEDDAPAFFASLFGVTVFKPGARAVASVQATTALGPCNDDWSADNPPNDDCEQSTGQEGERVAHCIFDPPLGAGEDPDSYLPDCVKLGVDPIVGDVVPGDAHCVFTGEPPVEDPDQYLPECRTPGSVEGGISGAQAFTMSRACDSIFYTGTPVTGQGQAPLLGAFGTNGGLTFEGSRQKRIDTLGFDRGRCGSLLPEPPNNNPGACDQAAQNRQASCARHLVDFGTQIPLGWPVPPPPLPTPLPAGTTWNPAVHYPGSCILLTPPAGTTTYTLTALPGQPGIYCVSGADVLLQITNSMIAGDGYTFFALNGAKIGLSSNGTSVRFYWPSGCGPRPDNRPLSFTCFGRQIVGYDPRTVLYSTSVHSPTTALPALCTDAAICFNGSGGSIEGDIFAPHPLSFPPATDQYGGTVWMAGGSAAAGNGFVESWNLVIQGNSGTYSGVGPVVGGTIVGARQGELTQDIHCEFDPPVDDPDQYLPTCIIPGPGGQVGTLDEHCIFNPPLPPGEDPDDFLPSCIKAGETVWATQDPVVVIADIGMDE